MTTEADRQAAIEVLREFDVNEAWIEAIDAGAPNWLVERCTDLARAFREADLDWLLEHAHPELVISQPEGLPDANTYLGPDGIVENLLDWPREWENFRIDPQRIFAVRDGVFVIDAIHRGRSLRMGFEMEGQVVWLLTYEGDMLRRWQMFRTVDEAREAAGAG
jgi:hypothetical protein